MVSALKQAAQAEDTKRAQSFLKLAVENADIAAQTGLPLCQDTGMAVVFAQIGQDVHITGGLFQDAVKPRGAPGICRYAQIGAFPFGAH